MICPAEPARYLLALHRDTLDHAGERLVHSLESIYGLPIVGKPSLDLTAFVYQDRQVLEENLRIWELDQELVIETFDLDELAGYLARHEQWFPVGGILCRVVAFMLDPVIGELNEQFSVWDFLSNAPVNPAGCGKCS